MEILKFSKSTGWIPCICLSTLDDLVNSVTIKLSILCSSFPLLSVVVNLFGLSEKNCLFFFASSLRQGKLFNSIVKLKSLSLFSFSFFVEIVIPVLFDFNVAT